MKKNGIKALRKRYAFAERGKKQRKSAYCKDNASRVAGFGMAIRCVSKSEIRRNDRLDANGQTMPKIKFKKKGSMCLKQHTGIYKNLIVQLDKVTRHNKQGSYKTRERYYEAMQRFCAYLAEAWRLQKLQNISGKHLEGYVREMQKKGKAAATIKTDLAAIRFFHDQIPNTRHPLPNNSELDLVHRSFGRVDRTWSQQEFNRMIYKAWEQNREDYAAILVLGRYGALRLEECFNLDTAAVEKALKTGVLHVRGKGGLERDIPMQDSIHIELKKMLAQTPRGQKLFVRADDKTHLAMKRLQNFICYHRQTVQDPASERPMTFHGLRHTCAAEWYRQALKEGLNPYQARKRVAELLGHHRDDVTRIYLASLKGKGDQDV